MEASPGTWKPAADVHRRHRHAVTLELFAQPGQLLDASAER
jgi:hypothetical protein